MTGWEKEREAFFQYLENSKPIYENDLSLRAVGQGVRTLMYAGQILDDEPEDVEELRRRIEANESAQNIGALVGLAAGVVLGVAEKREQEEQMQQPMQQTM